MSHLALVSLALDPLTLILASSEVFSLRRLTFASLARALNGCAMSHSAQPILFILFECEQIIKRILEDSSVIEHLSPELQAAARDGYLVALRAVFWFCALFAFLAWLSMLAVSRKRYQ